MRQYAASVLGYKGQPSVCKFLIKCPCCGIGVNYTQNILRDVIACRLAENKIQLDLLGKMTLEEVFQFKQTKEAGEWSARHLLETQGADANHSQYRHGKQENLKNNKIHNKNETCSYCRERGHGKNSPTQTRKNDCPAYDKTCAHCSRANHLYADCMQQQDQAKLQASSLTIHQHEKPRMLSLTRSALPLVSARPEMDGQYT